MMLCCLFGVKSEWSSKQDSRSLNDSAICAGGYVGLMDGIRISQPQ